MTQLERITFNEVRHGDVLLVLEDNAAPHKTVLWRSGIAAAKHNFFWLTPAGTALAEIGDTIYRITKGKLRP